MRTVADVIVFTLAVTRMAGLPWHTCRIDDRSSCTLFAIPMPRRQLNFFASWRPLRRCATTFDLYDMIMWTSVLQHIEQRRSSLGFGQDGRAWTSAVLSGAPCARATSGDFRCTSRAWTSNRLSTRSRHSRWKWPWWPHAPLCLVHCHAITLTKQLGLCSAGEGRPTSLELHCQLHQPPPRGLVGRMVRGSSFPVLWVADNAFVLDDNPESLQASCRALVRASEACGVPFSSGSLEVLHNGEGECRIASSKVCATWSFWCHQVGKVDGAPRPGPS